jgi:uncharacterized protein
MLEEIRQKLKQLSAVLMIVFVTLFFQHTVWAEVATATDETDLVVAGKMIQQQQKINPPNNYSKTNTYFTASCQ